MKRALQFILAVSVFGVIFSGVLTYGEVFEEKAMSCPAPVLPRIPADVIGADPAHAI